MSTQQNRPFVSLTGAITMIMGMVLLYFLATGLFKILGLIAFPLLAVTLFINHNVVVNYGKWILEQFKNQNWPVALGASALTFFAFPFVVLFLFGKAMIMKKITEAFPEGMDPGNMTGRSQTRTEDDFVDYEEIVEEPLELPDLPKETQEKIDRNDYEDLF